MALLSDSLMAHYKMNDDAATAVVVDETGNYNGTYKDAGGDLNTDTGASTGKILGALAFDSIDEYIILSGTAIDGANPLELDDSFTISFWIYIIESKSFYIINNYQGSAAYIGNHINIHFDPSGAKVQIKANIDDNVNPVSLIGSVLNLNQWYHVVLMRDKGNIVKLYINAVEDDSKIDITTGSILSNMDWVIGAKAQTPIEENFNGLVDNVMFFNKAVIPLEGKYLYNSGAGVESIPTLIELSHIGQRFSSHQEI